MQNKIDFNTERYMISTLPVVAPRPRLGAGETSITNLPEILFITSYPPRECGIATYSQDLLKALNNKFSDSFSLKVCALESEKSDHAYPDEVKYILDTNDASKYVDLLHLINENNALKLILVQHEFGLFQHAGENAFLQFLYGLTKPAVVVFHTVLPHPDTKLKTNVLRIAAACESVVVMTRNAAKILKDDYGVSLHKIVVIQHGTHLVPHLNKEVLKAKYGLTGRKVLSTFGLLGPGKGIETTLDALPAIVEKHPDAIFLAIGKTHPGVVQSEGEVYRKMLEAKVEASGLQAHVKFVNRYLPLQDLLEYLQLTDIYLFTSTDPNQAVSGTFSYAMSCGCPIISTPIPHAQEVLQDNTGIIVDFQNADQLTASVNRLMSDEAIRTAYSAGTLQRIVPTVWENSAIAHAILLQNIAQQDNWSEVIANSPGPLFIPQLVYQSGKIPLQYRLPPINLDHIKKMTTDFGIIQFSKINQPDIESGYTIDDNARALIAVCMHYELTREKADLPYISTYLNFIQFCQQPKGNFLNYADSDQRFTGQNDETNLSDANGRAIWALGYLMANRGLLPAIIIDAAGVIMQRALQQVETMHSTRAMAFVIKGLYYSNLGNKKATNSALIKILADRLVQMYRHEAEPGWQWFESYLTYGNSILPEAMLCAYLDTGDLRYKEIAKTSFDFLLSLTFNARGIKVISNKTWLQKGKEAAPYGEQPIDVAYTILAMSQFYRVFKTEDYALKMVMAFNWFLGNNHLHQIIYNPCTGGCYDGLEEESVNLNQGAESTVSYLMARLTMEQRTAGDHSGL